MTYQCCSLRRVVGSCARLGLISASLFSIVALLSGTRLAAQVPSGINGTVTDISGAVIVGAEVAAKDKSTSVVSHAVTSSAGTYVIVGLPIQPRQFRVYESWPRMPARVLPNPVCHLSTTAYRWRRMSRSYEPKPAC